MKESSPTPFPTAGDVLIASPSLLDPHFVRSLVYLQESDPQGSLGFILNRPLGKTLGDLLSNSALPGFLKPLPLFFGGPVHMDQFMLALFTRTADGHRIRCELQPDAAEIDRHLSNNTGWLRAFIGYAGWTENQLQGECRQADWHWTRSDEEMVRNNLSEELWSLYASGDERWKSFRSRFPKNWGRN